MPPPPICFRLQLGVKLGLANLVNLLKEKVRCKEIGGFVLRVAHPDYSGCPKSRLETQHREVGFF